jgi:uncharacterized RDD family membrane protein YckC
MLVGRALTLLLVAVIDDVGDQAPGPGVRERLGRLAGSVSNRVLEEVDADAVLARMDVERLLDRVDVDRLVSRIDIDTLVSRIDIDTLVGRIDIDTLVGRIDIDTLVSRIDIDTLVGRIDIDTLVGRIDIGAVIDRIDLDAVLAEVDLDAVLAEVDLDPVLDRVDLDRVLDRIDLEGLVRRAGIPELVADSTGQVATSALDLARRQFVGLDIGVGRVALRSLRRDPDELPPGPPALVADDRDQVEAPDPRRPRAKARVEVSGYYAGPVSRVAAFAGDVALATSAFTAGTAALSWILATLFDVGLALPDDWRWLWAVVFVGWLATYWWISTAVAGRTPVMALAGLRVVARDGAPLRPLSAAVRTAALPLSLLAFGIGGAWMVVDRERRALHDLLAGSAVVYDWGGRPAEMPSPLGRWIAAHGDPARPR